MKAAITGASGFIGSQLKGRIESLGHSVLPLGRQELALAEDQLAGLLEGCDVIINLAGAPLLARHTDDYKKTIRDSRINTTLKLASAIKLMTQKPSVLVSASAIGIYSDHTVSTESSPEYANDFGAQVCKDWEAAANTASTYTTVCIARMGVVLDANEGALAKMLLPFKLGLGAKIGSGNQTFSWIHIQDLVNAYMFVIDAKKGGVYNLSSPGYLSNEAYTNALANILGRPARLKVPEFALRLVYGGGAITITSGQAVYPERLINEGFKFKFPVIEDALHDLLKG